MDNNLRKGNRIPGTCEEFTKPEDIKELQKFLRQVKAYQEEEVTLQEDNLEVAGRANLPKIDALGTYRENLEVPDLTNLPNTKLPLDSNPNDTNLSDTRLDITDDREIILQKLVEKIGSLPTNDPSISPGNLVSSVPSLGESVIGLGQNPIDHELETYKETLSTPDSVPLENYVESLSDPRTQSLVSHRETLGDTDINQPKALEKEVKSVDKNPEDLKSLGNNVVGLSVPKSPELTSTKETLSVSDDEIKLGTDRVKPDTLPGDKISSLRITSDKLDIPEKDVSLPQDPINLDPKTIDPTTLSTEKQKLSGIPRNPDIPGDTSDIPGDIKEVALDSTSEMLDPKPVPVNLSNHLEELVGKLEDISIPEQSTKLGPTPEPIKDLGKENSVLPGKLSAISLDEHLEKLGIREQDTLELSKTTSPRPGKDKDIKHLGTDKEKLGVKNEVKDLGNFLSHLGVGDLNLKLEDESTLDKLTVEQQVGLGEYREPLKGSDKEPELMGPDTLDNLHPNSLDSLGTYKEPLNAELQDPSLMGPETLVNLSDSRNPVLGELVEKIQVSDKNKLYTPDETLTGITDDQTKLDQSGEQHKRFDPNTEDLYDTVVGREGTDPKVSLSEDKEKLGGEHKPLNNLEDEQVKLEDRRENPELSEELVERPESTSDDEIKHLEETLSSREDLHLYYTNILKFAQNKKLDRGWASKVTALMSAYLSGDDISPARAKEFEKALLSTVIDDMKAVNRDAFLGEGKSDPAYKPELGDSEVSTKIASNAPASIPSYKLPQQSLFGGALNPSSYLRFIAEKTVGLSKSKGLRATLMDEALGLLVLARDKMERATRSNRDRLPGNDASIIGDTITGGLGNAISKSIGRVSNYLFGFGDADLSLPHNRPSSSGENPTSRRGETSFEPLNQKGNVTSEPGKKNFLNSLSSMAGFSSGGTYNFTTAYGISGLGLTDRGLYTTLSDLSGVDARTGIKTVEDLYAALRDSPYINSALNVTSSDYSPVRVQTLDSNATWEVVFKPFAGAENGEVSYLPPIREINVWNKIYHGVITDYSRWVPVNSFELGKTKLTTKSLALFDGEISYPVSMEFTNELRLTFVDDQYKSWRRYFEKCMEVSIYNSMPHKMEEYENDDYNIITTVDKNYNCVAPYKNITFRCILYSMTPQYSTISKYDLLVVMKDFIEERTGEVDGGSGDLTVAFSVVGENPGLKVPVSRIEHKPKQPKVDPRRLPPGSIISRNLKSIVKVL